MKKTTRELNQEHDRRMSERVRPKEPEYSFKELEAIVNTWIRESLKREQT